jgi:hypothetical protein
MGFELQQKESAGWEFVELHTYSPQERMRLASELSESYSEEARQVIDALDGDPFLCALAPDNIVLPIGISRSDLLKEIFDDALRRAVEEAAHARPVVATPGEFVSAVEGLIELMLRLEEPEPSWEQVRSILGDRGANLLHVLSETNQLGWIEQSNDEERWRWKHDRLRDALVGRWLANHALPRVVGGDATDEIRAWLSDPGLAEAWALALIFRLM